MRRGGGRQLSWLPVVALAMLSLRTTWEYILAAAMTTRNNNNDNNENKSENKSSDGDNDNNNSNINNSSAGDNNDTGLCWFGNQGGPLSSTGVFAIGSVGIWGMAPFCTSEEGQLSVVTRERPFHWGYCILYSARSILTRAVDVHGLSYYINTSKSSSSSPAVGEISW